MRIGFLTERMIRGYGVDLVTDRLAKGLSQRGHDVAVFCCFHDDTYTDREYELSPLHIPASIIPSRYEGRAERVVRHLENDRDVWIVESFPFFRAASQFKRPWIAHDHGVVPSEYFGLVNRKRFDYIRRTQYGEYFKNCSRVLCVSEFLKSILPLNLQGRAEVIHPGIDHYERQSFVDLREGLGLSGVVLLYLGRSTDTSPYKCVNDLLDTCQRLRDDKVNITLVIGTSCSLEEQSRLESRGATVLNGVLPAFMPSVYMCADMYATATKWEGFDLPLLEASYFGLPVVAFGIGAHPEIVQNGQTGYLVKDKQEFAEGLRKLIDDDDLRKRMGKEGAAFASRFKWNQVVEAFEGKLKAAMDRRSI